MNQVNINFDRPQFNKEDSARNMEAVNRWISDSADKLNMLVSLLKTDGSGGNLATNYTVIRNIVNRAELSDLVLEYETFYEFPNVGRKDMVYMDKSTGDLYLYGVGGKSVYTSIGIANGDTLFGGNA